MFDVIKEILISKKQFTETNYKRLEKVLVSIEINLKDSKILIVGSLIETNNIINGSNNINLRKVNVKQFGFDNMYIDKELIEDKFYQIIDQLKERKITSTKFNSILLNKIYPFYDRNGKMCKILFVNDYIIRQNYRQI